MSFTVSMGVRAIQNGNDILVLHRSEQAEIHSAIRKIMGELRQDAHLKGVQVRGRPSFRKITEVPILAFVLIQGSKARIKKLRYWGPLPRQA